LQDKEAAMKKKLWRLTVAALGAVLFLAAGADAAKRPPQYHFADLGTLGGNESEAYGINDGRQVVGYAFTHTGEKHAFLYSKGRKRDLGTLGGTESWAYGINNAGQVVGYATTPEASYHAFLYSKGVMTDLGTLGVGDSFAFGINDLGEVVGVWGGTGTPGTGFHAFLYSNGVMTDLGTLPGGGTSVANAINEHGRVVGQATTATGETHAFLARPIH
jgi:probable HAF family extracellular repeat protein